MINISERIFELNEELQIFLSEPFENMTLSYKLQMKLLDTLCKMEELIKANKQSIQMLKNDTKSKELSKEQRIDIGLEIKSIQEENIYIKEEMKRVREIGDSIAFVYFNKHDLKPLCWKQSAGFINGKVGLEKELQVLKKVFDNGHHGILNDLTNSIRYGDITLNINGKPHVIEIKSSKNKNMRIKRQEEAIEEVMKIVHCDEIENFMQNSTFRRMYAPSPEINYVVELRGLIDKAFECGRAWSLIEEGLLYIAEYEDSDLEQFRELLGQIKEPIVFFLNSLKRQHENYTPFPLIFKDEVSLMEFYHGNLLISIIVDFAVIKSRIEEKGHKVEYEDGGLIITTDKGVKIVAS
ncbi:MAG: hypothetical protein WBL93_13585, partial [Lutisporaceae bacterium]